MGEALDSAAQPRSGTRRLFRNLCAPFAWALLCSRIFHYGKLFPLQEEEAQHAIGESGARGADRAWCARVRRAWYAGWKRFVSAPAGQRFERQFRRSPLRNRYWRVLLLVISVLLILTGILTLLVPPIPGVTLILLGGMLGARLSLRAAQLCDRAESGLRRGWKALVAKCRSH